MSIYIWPESIRCSTETNELGSDEPYFTVSIVDRDAPVGQTSLYGPYGDMDEQETRAIPFRAFWGFDGSERPVPRALQLYIIVALAENDNGSPESVRSNTELYFEGAVLGAQSLTKRDEIVPRLIAGVQHVMTTSILGLGDDDVIGDPQSVTFSTTDLIDAERGIAVRKPHHFVGDGGHYIISFVAQNRGQSLWRFCERCRTLFFSGFPSQGVCPAGGAHAGAKTTYFMPHERALAIGGQENWRFCDKCFALVYGGFSNHGRCPVGGEHNPTGMNYIPVHDFPGPGPGPGPGQPEWRFCNKCQVMFFGGSVPNPQVCAAGGAHDSAGSFNYRLDLQV